MKHHLGIINACVSVAKIVEHTYMSLVMYKKERLNQILNFEKLLDHIHASNIRKLH